MQDGNGTTADEIIADQVTTDDWLRAGLILLVALSVGILTRFIVMRGMRRADTDPSVGNFIGSLSAFLILIAGMIYALWALDVRLTPLLGALGIGGLALAFALQEVIENFVSGVILQVRRPFRAGDQIWSNNYEGTVEQVNFRATVLRSFNGELVVLPNALVVRNPLKNFTEFPVRRTALTLRVSYETELERAKEVILHAVRATPGVIETPPPQVMVETFGEYAVCLSVGFWHAPDVGSMWATRDNVATRISSALREAKIPVAVPQVSVRETANGRANAAAAFQSSSGREPPPDEQASGSG